MPDMRAAAEGPTGPGAHWEGWSRNGEVCITGLDPPFAGGARLASCLEGSVYEYVIGRDPFHPLGTPRRKLVILAEERQVFGPARAATLATGVRRAWATGLDAVCEVT